MKKIKIISIILLLIPALSFSQLKKDVNKPNISNTLQTGNMNNSVLGFLDPSKLTMSHNFSMSFSTFGGHGMMLNTYVNTLNYQFNDKLFLTTNLGIMNSPVNSLPGNSYLNENHIFGGAELRYLPTKNTRISLSFESVPYFYSRNRYYNSRYPFGIPRSQ